MRSISALALALLIALPGSAQPFSFVAVDGPWLSDAVRYARADGLVLARSGTVLGRSWDGGATWQRFTEAPDIRSVRAYRGGLLAGSTQGLVESFDDGETWTVVAFEDQLVTNLHVQDSLYLQTSDGTVYRSGGDPSRWTALSVPGVDGISPVAAGPGGALAVRDDRVYETGDVHTSTDYGETFVTANVPWPPTVLVYEEGALYGTRGDTYISSGTTVIPIPGGVYRFDAQAQAFDLVRSAPSFSSVRRQPDGRLTYVGDGALRLLLTGQRVSLPATPQRIGDAVITDAATLLRLVGDVGPPPVPDGVQYVETHSGMMVHRDGELAHTGFRNASASAVAELPDGSLVIGTDGDGGFGGIGDVYRFDRGWQPLGAGSTARRVVPLWGQPDSLVVVPDYGPDPYFFAMPSRVIVDGAATDAMAEIGYGESLAAVGFSEDRAVSAWLGYLDYNPIQVVDRSGTVLNETYVQDRVLSVLAQPDGAWAGADRGPFDDEAPEVPVRFSNDDGATWQDRSVGLGGAGVLAMASADGGPFASTADGVFRWDGAAWAQELAASGIATFTQHDGTLYAGGDGAVYRRDAGVWTAVSEGLDGARVRGLAVGSDAEGAWMVAATNKGVRTTRPSLLVGTDDAPPSAERRALRAYPNPVRGALTIEAPTAGAAVEVFDAVGRRVARLTAGPGGQARWDAQSAPAGVYFVRVPDGGPTTQVVVVR